MRLSITKTKNREFFYITKDFYSNGKRTTKIVEKLGNVTDLMKAKNMSHDELVSWAKQYALEKTKSENEKKERISLTLSPTELIPIDESRSFNCGYLFLQSILYDLRINNTFRNISSRHRNEFNLESIFTDLIFSRILSPSSKKSSFEFCQSLLEKPKYQLEDVYRALSILAKESEYIQEDLYKNSNIIHKRNTSVLYYDCTNYFFEIEQEEGSRKYGKGKEHRPNPIIGMGLFMDGDGIPLSFSLFPGNQNEQLSLQPHEQRIIRDFELSRFIYCSDSSLASRKNKEFNSFGDRAYIITQSIKKLKKEDKDLALNLDGFKSIRDDAIIHSIEDTDKNNLYYKELPIIGKINERLIVTYSKKYAEYQKRIRDGQLERARAMITEGGKIKKNRRNPNDPSRFVDKITSNENGEVVETQYFINQDIYDEESRYDGFYAVSTNLMDGDVSKILEISERRWQIEECFRILKTDFKARPVYLHREERINAHFLTCFVALLVIRLLNIKLNNEYTIPEILKTLRKMNLTDTGYGQYIPSYTRTKLTDRLHEVFGFRTDYEIISKKSIRTIIKNTK